MVAIIDQGVDWTGHKLDGIAFEEFDIAEEGSDRSDFPINQAYRCHGTNIAQIIHTISPSVKIFSVRLIPKQKINVDLLVKALKYCSERCEIKIINISLGILTKSPNRELLQACLACHENGKILVAAAHANSDLKCYPAAFPFVFGVGIGMIKDVADYSYLQKGYINILAKGIHQRVIGENGQPTLSSGTSYASAAFTGILSRFMCSKTTTNRSELLDLIKRNAIPAQSTHYPIGKGQICIDKFNYNSKSKWLAFPTDDPNTVKIAETCGNVLLLMKYPFDPNGEFSSSLAETKIVSGILSPNIFNFVDTLVLGNFYRNKHLVNLYFGYALIDFFIENNANIVVWDRWIYGQIRSRMLANEKNFLGRLKLSAN